jgi:hypothetical protein
MSNHNAIATVTATLRQLLNSAVSTDVPGASASFLTPDGPMSGVANPGVNIFLYQATPNAAWRNEDLPTRDSSSRLVARPKAALDLHYLFTCYGKDEDFEPQRVLGSVVRALHAKPVLTRSQIADALTAYPVLLPCDLANDVELVKFSELPLTLEELSKLWSVFFQTTYHLSVAYRGNVVLIETEDTFASPLPVRTRNVYVEILREPVVNQAVAASADDDPILGGADIRLRGTGFVGEAVDIRIDGVSALNANVISDLEATATLPPLTAGVHGAQIVHQRLIGTPPAAHPAGVASNVCPFVLAPKIHKNGTYDITVLNPTSRTVGSVTYDSADMQITVDPTVGKDQRVAYLLNEMVAADARSYTFLSEPRTADTNTITIPVVDVIPGQYLVRVQVDGADSPLDFTAGSYSDPKVTL